MTRNDDPDPDHPAAPTAAEIAALTARLREMAARGAGADRDERAALIADKEALLARIADPDHDGRHSHRAATNRVRMPEEMRAAAAPWGPDSPPPDAREPDDPVALAERIGELRARNGGPSRAEEIVSPAEAADRLTALGHDRARAAAMVADYLDETSREVGVPMHLWGLDQYDLDRIAADHDRAEQRRAETAAAVDRAHEAVAAVPTPRGPAPHAVASARPDDHGRGLYPRPTDQDADGALAPEDGREDGDVLVAEPGRDGGPDR